MPGRWGFAPQGLKVAGLVPGSRVFKPDVLSTQLSQAGDPSHREPGLESVTGAICRDGEGRAGQAPLLHFPVLPSL